jgi:hypothetical protein
MRQIELQVLVKIKQGSPRGPKTVFACENHKASLLDFPVISRADPRHLT